MSITSKIIELKAKLNRTDIEQQEPILRIQEGLKRRLDAETGAKYLTDKILGMRIEVIPDVLEIKLANGIVVSGAKNVHTVTR